MINSNWNWFILLLVQLKLLYSRSIHSVAGAEVLFSLRYKCLWLWMAALCSKPLTSTARSRWLSATEIRRDPLMACSFHNPDTWNRKAGKWPEGSGLYLCSKLQTFQNGNNCQSNILQVVRVLIGVIWKHFSVHQYIMSFILVFELKIEDQTKFKKHDRCNFLQKYHK